ncbi:MutS-related protein [Nocardia camponoti]|uniref:MutS-related protein n=1 Tax=Nocardia camponoti TaxID=1616106 RepID=UPI00166467EB|nr:DNA mismatch repair protein MutS [Nocardia camponoti]
MSIVWPSSANTPPLLAVNDAALHDLHIDEVINAILGADEYDLRPIFAHPTSDVATVRYRHEVFADLAVEDIRTALTGFAANMRQVRDELATGASREHPHQRGWWELTAAAHYLDALTGLAAELDAVPIRSVALTRWRTWLLAFLTTQELTDFARVVAEVRAELDHVRYTLRISGRTIEVMPAAELLDHSAVIANLFARFGVVAPAPAGQPRFDPAANLQEQLLDEVAAVSPLAFGRLTAFGRDYRVFPGYAAVATFDRELAFYLTYLRFADRVGTSRLCVPELADDTTAIHADNAFDLALATQWRAQPTEVVANDWQLSTGELAIIVTGPNQGGKTTFARAFGQLLYLTALGGLVPASSARLPLADRIDTHFAAAEAITDPTGRLATELLRVRDTLDVATGRSVVILNETLSATGSADAATIGRDILARIAEVGAVALWVTFFDELADMGSFAVSMVATTDPDDPGRRTFRLERRAADGDAQAVMLARRFGLTRERVADRVNSCA